MGRLARSRVQRRHRLTFIHLAALLVAGSLAASGCETLRASTTTFVSIGDSYASGEGSPVPYDHRDLPIDIEFVGDPAELAELPPTSANTSAITEEKDFEELFGGYPFSYSGMSPDGQFITALGRAPLPTTTNSLPCHRSPYNGRALAYAALTRSVNGYSGTYYDFACSGATIEEGLLGAQNPEQDFTAPALPPVFAQLELVDLLELEDDWVLMISIGGNDIGFGHLVAECLRLNAESVPLVGEDNCVERNLDNLMSGDWPPIYEDKAGLGRLPGLFAQLADTIENGTDVDATWTPPKKVLITDYPTPVGSPLRGFCDGWDDGAGMYLRLTLSEPVLFDSAYTINGEGSPVNIPLGGAREQAIGVPLPVGDYEPWGSTANISTEESRDIVESVLEPLNAAIAAAVAEHADDGWELVEMDDQWEIHPVCSQNAWVNDIHSSFVVQGNKFGAVHPNCNGHLHLARTLYPAMVEAAGDLAVDPSVDPYPSDTLEEVRALPCISNPGIHPTARANEYPLWGSDYWNAKATEME